MKRSNKLVLIFTMIFTICIVIEIAAIGSMKCIRADSAQPVTFINTDPDIAMIGFVKFTEFDKNGEPTAYEVISEGWSDQERTVMLEPGYYGATKFHAKTTMIIYYWAFWVGSKPLTIEM